MDPILLAFLGYILGCLGRTTYDALFKYLETPDTTWNQKYTVSLLISVILTLIMSAATFPLDIVPTGNPSTVLLSTVTMGFTVNHLVNKGIAFLSQPKPVE